MNDLPHPSPQLARRDWLSLDGAWDFGLGATAERVAFGARITVPFCVESDAAGLRTKPRGNDFWYRREVDIPPAWAGRAIFWRIGAADYFAEGFVNGAPVGSHAGGFTPMAWRIDAALRPGRNELLLHVRETRRADLPRGKQTHLPFAYAVFYRPFSGVWQSMWLEARGTPHLALAHPVAGADGAFDFHVEVPGGAGAEIEIALTHPDGAPDAVVRERLAGETASVRVAPERAAWWSPNAPNLYGVRYAIRRDGAVVDEAAGYAGLRTVTTRDGRVLLNGVPLVQKLLLYQAYYPGGWVTPVGEGELRRDVELVKAMGFNGVRVHQTMADPRFLYWCDRLGLVVWDEMPSPFVFARVDRTAFETLLREAVARDRGHPSVIAWVLFNETWGILDTLFSEAARDWVRGMVRLARELDPSRPIIDNSGYEHLDSDILDVHHYLAKPEAIRALYAQLTNPAAMRYRHWRNLYFVAPSRVYKSPLAPGGRTGGEPVIVSECGGHGFGAYGDKSLSLEDGLRQTLALLAEQPHLQGFCYTQFCDVAQERNGLVTFDRVPKLPPERIAEILGEYFAAAGE